MSCVVSRQSRQRSCSPTSLVTQHTFCLSGASLCAACFSNPVLWLTCPDLGIDFFGDSLRESQKNRRVDKLPFLHLQRSVHPANKISQRRWGRCLVMPQTQKAEAPSRSVGDFRRGFSSEKSPDILFYGGCVNKGTSWSFKLHVSLVLLYSAERVVFGW